MIQVIKLAHVGLGAGDLSRQAEFYTDKWGLEAIDEHGSEMFLRAEGPDHHVLSLHGGEPGLHHVALEVASAEDVDRAFDELSALGVEIVTPPTTELEPGVARAVRFKDPDGNTVELVAGVDEVHDAYGPREAKPYGLNHLVYNCADRDVMEGFYRDTLGFKFTDQVGDLLTFYRCNANHHSIAFGRRGRDGRVGMNHAAFDLKNYEDWLKAVFWAGEKGVARTWGPGRHLVGNNLFSYYLDPENNVVEYTTEVEQITDPGYVPRRRPLIPDVWVSATPHF
jgi:catechol 2,3-dioxygenase-like lactoylglutathione lyase family enzyme